MTDNPNPYRHDDDYYLANMMRWLMPWIEKNDGTQELGDWENKISEIMMVRLVKMWLSDANKQQLDRVLHYYHPLDRAAMCYALLVFLLTGTKIHFRKPMPEQHFRTLCKAIEADMPQLPFASHLLYTLVKFGKKHITDYGTDA